MVDPEPPLVAHGVHLISLAHEGGACLRLAGSAAIALRCQDVLRQTGPMIPAPRDLDFVGPLRDAPTLDRLFTDQGYAQDRALQIATEGRRWTLTAPDGSHCVDVFFDEMQFSHHLDLRGRLALDPFTLTPADLLLAKLQYIEPARTDLGGILLLLATHPVGNADGESLNAERIAGVLAGSWGYHRTASANLRRASHSATDILPLSGALAQRAVERSHALLTAIDAAPKSLRWRLRAVVGTRLQWYDEVENGDVF